MYNLAFIHRAYITTYSSDRKAKIPELFIPVKGIQKSPSYYKGNDSNLYLKFEIEKSFFGAAPATIPNAYLSSISNRFIVYNNNFILKSVNGAKRNSSDSLSTEFKTLNSELRKEFQYIRGNKYLWYLKRSSLKN
jgi:hypothetical protein